MNFAFPVLPTLNPTCNRTSLLWNQEQNLPATPFSSSFEIFLQQHLQRLQFQQIQRSQSALPSILPLTNMFVPGKLSRTPLIIPPRMIPSSVQLSLEKTTKKRVLLSEVVTSSKMIKQEEEEENEDSTVCQSSSSSDQESTDKEDETYSFSTDEATFLSKLKGESRLSIQFISLGRVGKSLQKFGKSNVIIPDGLVAQALVYHQNWRMEIRHLPSDEDGIVRITWKVTNLGSNKSIELEETHSDAKRRIHQGWTISNKCFRLALDQRASEFQTMMQSESNPLKLSNYRSLVETLKPKMFSEGPLVFGLQHRKVQEEMIRQLNQSPKI